MCGVAGIVADGAKSYSESLQRMVARLAHRGPDAEGKTFYDNCALGHSRLSIVDLETGVQPMRSSSKRKAITFNGEIYGYQRLRDQFGSYAFQTTSDTEVILAAYIDKGPSFIGDLPGMFAFAIWDDDRQELLCARDRFGQKPFFYGTGANGEFVFASEIKAILASGLIEPILSNSAVSHYLRYLHVHPATTIYRNIHVLPPAHLLRFSAGDLSLQRYWHPPAETVHISVPDAVDRFRELLDQAVASHLVADVPVGAFLSGGLDSSTIVGTASKHCQDLRTFSFGFPDAKNELSYAADVAKMYGTNHTELMIQGYDLGKLILEMQQIYDEPFADSSNIPTYLICQAASKHLKVILTGDGGDEMLGGYTNWYLPLINMHREQYYSAIKAMLFRQLAKSFRCLSPRQAQFWQYREWGVNMHRDFSSLTEAHHSLRSFMTDQELQQMGLSQQREDASRREISGPEDSILDDVDIYLPGDILTKIDRASMAHGLELRAPFLDNELSSFCLSLPLNMKIHENEDKYLLRRAFAAEWPDSVKARSKCGFGAPVTEWMKLKSVRVLIDEYLRVPERKLYSMFDYERCKSVVGRCDYSTWAMLNLSIWMETRVFDFNG